MLLFQPFAGKKCLASQNIYPKRERPCPKSAKPFIGNHLRLPLPSPIAFGGRVRDRRRLMSGLVPFVPMSQGPTRNDLVENSLACASAGRTLRGGILNADLADGADLRGISEKIWVFQFEISDLRSRIQNPKSLSQTQRWDTQIYGYF